MGQARLRAEGVVIAFAMLDNFSFQLVLDMITTGAFNHIDNLHMEWHGLIFFRQDNEAKMISKLAPAIQQIGKNCFENL